MMALPFYHVDVFTERPFAGLVQPVLWGERTLED